jgi:hypothetical protein
MKKHYLLILLVFMAINFNAHAERINIPGLELPKLIISEVRPDNQANGYVQLTNVGDTPIDLEPFKLYSVHYNTRISAYSDSILTFNMANSATSETVGKVLLKGIIEPGESHVIKTVWDANNARGNGIPLHNTAIAQIANQFVFQSEVNNLNGWINKPEWQCWGFDSISPRVPRPTWTELQLLRAEASAGYLIHWKFQVDSVTWDSTFIDNFNFFYTLVPGSTMKGHEIRPIAGVEDAMTTGIMVRKAQVTQGNMNWDQSRGADAFNSEWLVIPKNTSLQYAFTTVGVHGVFDLDYTAKNPANVIVDKTAKTMSIPWQMARGDSLSGHFNLGPGMGWLYTLNESFEDSASFIARTGDKFAFYAVGNDVKKSEYTLQVRDAAADLAEIFPRRRLIIGEEIVFNEETETFDTIPTRYWTTGFVYNLGKGPEIDSIINVSFATRTDSLLLYFDKPAGATWEFVFVDGENRVDLQFGDKLKVTSANGVNSKEYFIAVDDHVKSNNALLSTVLWPDINPALYPRWIKGDTLPDFNPLSISNIVLLHRDAMQIPAFQYIPQNLRSRLEIEDAVDLDGTLEQRTTTVKVFAESDTISLTYRFIFQRQGLPVQPNEAEPFFSEFVRSIHTQGHAIEIFNPGTEDLDLSRYVIVSGIAGQTWQEAVETVRPGTTAANFARPAGDGIWVYESHYFPSYRWTADGSQAEWLATPNEENPYAGKGFLRPDGIYDPWVDPQDVWVGGVAIGTQNTHQKIRQEADFLWEGRADEGTLYPWGDSLRVYRQGNPAWKRNHIFLLKVLNDSIFEGIKDVRDATAYELIDRFDAIDNIIYDGININAGAHSLIRKPHISKGTLDRIGGADETAESSEWIFRTSVAGLISVDDLVDNIGLHIMDPITNYLSTVTSIVLKVTPGYQGDNLSITGSITDYTPASIALVLDKADASQTFAFKRGETVLADDQPLADGDVLEVTSGDGSTTTVYKLINSPLDNDTSLTAKAGSGLAVTGSKVTGATLGMTLKQAISNLEVAQKSVLNVINASTGALQPLVLQFDSLRVDVLVSDNILLEVVAENFDKATYVFDFGFASNKAVLFSNILTIDQEKRWILELPIGSTAPSMLSMVFANEGATVRILDKAGFERKVGFLYIDDVIEVTAPDGVTKAFYTFVDIGFGVSVNPRMEEAQNTIMVYPNPVRHMLHIQGLEVSLVEVYSISGALMISQNSYDNSINVSGLPHGVYIIRMMDVNGMVATKKFLKQ